jgi:anti-sigma regulatory factor (Ser/Thr protein kinase)
LPAGHPAEIAVEAQWTDPVLSITITDKAPPFDPLSAAVQELPRSLADAAPGGLGLGLIRSYVDDAHYARTENQNRFTVVFRWPRP